VVDPLLIHAHACSVNIKRLVGIPLLLHDESPWRFYSVLQKFETTKRTAAAAAVLWPFLLLRTYFFLVNYLCMHEHQFYSFQPHNTEQQQELLLLMCDHLLLRTYFLYCKLLHAWAPVCLSIPFNHTIWNNSKKRAADVWSFVVAHLLLHIVKVVQ
jgi:hypothetical protein